MIQVEDFDKVELRVGTIAQVCIKKKARKPAYKVTIDFGERIAGICWFFQQELFGSVSKDMSCRWGDVCDKMKVEIAPRQCGR